MNRYSLVLAVRTSEKAKEVEVHYAGVPNTRVKTVILPDVCQLNDCVYAIESEEPFDAVIHAGSPFRFDFEDTKKVYRAQQGCLIHY